MNKFKILIVGRNCSKYIDKSIGTCIYQDFDKGRFSVIYGDDCSDDGTFEKAKLYESKVPNFKAIQNKERLYKNFNIKDKLVNYTEPGDIIVLVDGDDWLIKNSVLSKLDNVYDKDTWLTYGRYREFPVRDVSQYYRPYSSVCVLQNNFRNEDWLASHLGTFRRDLYLKIKDEDFLDKDGSPLQYTGDMAMMFPMLEMSGDRSKFIDEVLYVYNRGNELSDDRVDAAKQSQTETYLRKKTPYQKLNEL